MNPRSFDLVVIGGGPAGSSGAVAATLFGKGVALVEMETRVPAVRGLTPAPFRAKRCGKVL
jgi:pyruvate/2-oxoglutarate dehydrogenase complex dihydrolipoamide dehydrogenase (E3) component